MKPDKRQKKRLRLSYALSSFALAATLFMVTQQLSSAGDSAKAATPSSGRRHTSAAYVYDRPTLTLRDEDAKSLDQLNYSFALIKNGRVTGDHWSSIATFKNYIRKYPHILPVLSIGGWGADGFSQAASTEEGRKAFVDSAIALMNKHGFLGLDIDWEYPGSSAGGIRSSDWDKTNFTLLLCDLRDALDEQEKLDGKQRKLCIAVGADTQLVDNIDCQSVGKVVDQVNIMTYDLQQSAVASHHAALYASPRYPLSADAAVRAYRAAGIPAGKIMLGAAFYGHRWQNVQSEGDGLFSPSLAGKTTTITYREIAKKLAAGESTRYYDQNAKAPYLFDGSTFISYDDEVSILEKGAYVRQNGLMGLMCWEYGGDVQGALTSAMAEALE